MKVTPEQLKERLELPLEEKILWAKDVIVEYYCQMEGKVYVSFSGGKDSQVLLHLVRSIFPKVPAVFCDTGLEYPEIRKHVKTFDNVVWLKPKMKFPEVIKTYGVAVASKEVAQKVSEILSTKSLKLFLKRMFGDDKSNGKLPNKWRILLTAPFKISGKCCDIFKKEPFERHERLTGLKPYQGTTVSESRLRRTSYQQTGCNSFEKGKEKSRPVSIFTEKDIWGYAEMHGIKFCEVYYDRIVDGVLIEAADRTGCMFCLFGIEQEKAELNRFQKMSITHPRQYKYCIEELGLGKVLDFIGVKYAIEAKVKQQELDFEVIREIKG
jgi:3'-phosphoadenosine 5'-phosphosulfate sulfotransferase (PAPS reductase)/FAD synthetase